MISKLKIESVRAEKSVFELNPKFLGSKNDKSVDSDIGTDLKFEVGILINKNDDSQGIIRLSCEINTDDIEESPFFMEVTIIGEFSTDEEKFEDFVINSVSLLFPYLRAHISTVTSISGVDPVIIPAVNIMDLLKESEENEESEVSENLID